MALDWRITWGSGCGQALADQFCRNHGMVRAIGYLTYTPGHTWVPGSNASCDNNTCGGMLRIDCERGIAGQGDGPLAGRYYNDD